jgi:hypothetical protein
MKKVLFFMIILIILPQLLMGQEEEEKVNKKPFFPQLYSNILKTNPLPILWGPIPFTSEFRFVNEIVVAPQQSSQIGISYLGKSPLLKMFEDLLNPGGGAQPDILIRGFRFQFTHKIYLNKILNFYEDDENILYAPEGFFVGPMFSYSTARFTNQYLNQHNIYSRTTHWNLNFIVGYQHILPGGVTMEAFTGVGYKENRRFEHIPPQNLRIDTDDLGGHYNSNMKIILGFNFGIAF